jgi:prefoldin subunit 5
MKKEDIKEQKLSTEEVFLMGIRANIKANKLDEAIKLIDRRKNKLKERPKEQKNYTKGC